MRPQITIIAGDVGVTAATLCHEWAQSLANALDQPVEYGRADAGEIHAALWNATTTTIRTTARNAASSIRSSHTRPPQQAWDRVAPIRSDHAFHPAGHHR